MIVDKISAGRDVPNDLNVIIEIPAGSNVKYEIEKESGAVVVDRFVAMPMFYPANYGFINETLADDGDPTDVLVVTPQPIAPGSVIRCRPIGILNMEDESGVDEKVVAVPHTKVTTLYDNVNELEDLPTLLVDQIKAFFESYKDLEDGKWVKVTGWEDAKSAKEKIKRHADQYKG
ncbi:MAG: inorganic diphosphatase [Alphaproteobacteria bacterium]